jgi:hypothetical protein
LLRAQRRFAWYCRRAEAELREDFALPAATGPGGLPLPDWLRELRRRNQDLAYKHGLDRLRAAAERDPEAGETGPLHALAGASGTPIYWQTGAADRPPAPRLQADRTRQVAEAVLATELLLGALVFIWIFSHLGRLAGWLRRLWPEQLLLLAVLGWAAFGPSLVGVALVLLAVCGRLLALARWLPGLFRRHAPVAIPVGSGVSVP